jgi:iron(III) transport system substrate-binding protein
MRTGRALFALLVSLAACGCRSMRSVTVYTSVDQAQAEPILKEFQKRTGIQVRPVFDVEASKTTGLVSRLLAEKSRPQADVFWNNEFVQTLLLKQRGALAAYDSPMARGLPERYRDPEHYWAGAGGRLRVLLVNTSQAQPEQVPRSMAALAASPFPPAKIGLALPLFGTAATHAAALYAGLGPEKARALYDAIASRGWRIVDGNSVVRDLVAAGQLAAGITDSDDACGAIVSGAPVKILPLEDTLVIPGTVAMIAGAPHPAEARALIDYLLEPSTERRMMDSGFAQLSLRDAALRAPCLGDLAVPAEGPGLGTLLAQFERSRADMNDLFVRAR